jgi:tetratricopeptide (TPR) repeat protein
MNDRREILRFPGRSQQPRDPPDEWDDEVADFEAWEPYVELLEKEDYPGLVEFCERELARHPGDLYGHGRLGNAYVLNGQYDRAIECMGKIHRNNPDVEDFQHVILDALFGLGKTEEDYEWVAAPRVLRLGQPVLDICYGYLRPKRKPRSVDELKTELLMQGYCTFSCDELMAALAADSRFVVQTDRSAQWATVRVRRTRER